MQTFLKKFIPLLLGLATLLPGFAFAAGVDVTTGAPAATTNVGATAGATTGSGLTVKMQAAISRGDQEITRRITALNDLATRVAAMQRVTAALKQTLATNIQAQITTLTQLKTKIDADTDAATLKTDVQSITQSYRIYALILPQSRIAAAADREVTLITMMSTLGSKLQARVQAGQTAGKDVSSLLAALTDMSTKLTDANTQAQAAVSVSVNLTPDNGDKTQMTANTTALKAARGDIGAAQKDLVAARKDVQTITDGLKSLSGSATASTTTP